MTALTLVTSTQPMVIQAGPPIRVQLPAGGWHVEFWAQPYGHTAVQVTDPAGLPVGWVASALVPVVSIDAGWSGWIHGSGGSRQWWALAIGHAPTEPDRPTVTFTRRTRRSRTALPLETADGLWVAHDGVWVGATVGRYTHVRLTARSETRARRLHLTTNLPAAYERPNPGGPRTGALVLEPAPDQTLRRPALGYDQAPW
jgi:hypothetical protein